MVDPYIAAVPDKTAIEEHLAKRLQDTAKLYADVAVDFAEGFIARYVEKHPLDSEGDEVGWDRMEALLRITFAEYLRRLE